MSLSRFAPICSLVLLACAPTLSVTRTGARYPARPADCTIEWENIDPDAASARTIGYVWVRSRGGDVETSAEAREQVRRAACAIGAEGVAVASASEFHTMYGPTSLTRVLFLRTPSPNASR